MALFDELRSFLAEVETQQVKAASAKKAEANTEAGSYEGGTSHPVKSVDDQTSDASEGERSSENSADVKSQVPAGGVDSNKAKPPEQEGQQFDVGMKSTSTGEDPAHEDDYKGTKDDPGTAHPAKTEDGEKYSSMNFIQLKKLTEKKANAILASVAVTATRSLKVLTLLSCARVKPPTRLQPLQRWTRRRQQPWATTRPCRLVCCPKRTLLLFLSLPPRT